MQHTDIEWIGISQQFDQTHVENPAMETVLQLGASGVRFEPGARIAIAVGSRGIAALADIVRATVQAVQAQGAIPFIIPAMGSHGGATAEGQRAVLHGYGIHEQSMGCPIVSSLDVISLHAQDSLPVYMARDAHEADGIIVINRVKPHTDFHGPVESGLMKMLVIGLGKHAQALAMHRYGVPGLRDKIPLAAQHVLATGKVLLGIGIVENAYGQVRCIRACPGALIPAVDAELLALARGCMATLPMEALDILLVDWIGKDISGTGLDTNVIGRMRIAGEAEPLRPQIGLIIADGLTPASHGNALGMGLCDIITENLRADIDFSATYENVITSGFLERGRMPLVAQDVPQALRWALGASGAHAPDTLRAAHITSTLSLTELSVTPAVLVDLRGSPVWDERNIVVRDEEGDGLRRPRT